MNDCFVMKCGGSTLAELPDAFFEELGSLQAEGMIPVIVHGGGPAISETLAKLDIPSEFVGGLRKTSEAVLDVVEMVLAGRINKEIVRRIQSSGATALGVSGVDGMLIVAEPVPNADEIGFVGDVVDVQASLVRGIVDMGYMPVIAPIGIDRAGQRYNINADTAAGAVASHIGAERMIVVTDVPGILRTADNGEKQVMPAVTREEIEAMIDSGDIYGGMIPKVRAAMKCLHGQVQEVVIVDGKVPGILRQVLDGAAVGTRIVKE
ncbi:acetylglutamate kinase [Xylanibacillus composti]|uniref:Acetylglutamate kinase n=1 Tax=Xylanibacillus composti TaxID=1572762 RepID=A0A8J4H5E3_9BACL|nr:acetylglutamate kinase [Xylanibacillus composti]GIQ70001.1 acetylglutamate kinase [Xylanibacillus composti]